MNLKEGTLRERKAKYADLVEKRTNLLSKRKRKERRKLAVCVIPEGDTSFGKCFSGKWAKEEEPT